MLGSSTCRTHILIDPYKIDSKFIKQQEIRTIHWTRRARSPGSDLCRVNYSPSVNGGVRRRYCIHESVRTHNEGSNQKQDLPTTLDVFPNVDSFRNYPVCRNSGAVFSTCDNVLHLSGCKRNVFDRTNFWNSHTATRSIKSLEPDPSCSDCVYVDICVAHFAVASIDNWNSNPRISMDRETCRANV